MSQKMRSPQSQHLQNPQKHPALGKTQSPARRRRMDETRKIGMQTGKTIEEIVGTTEGETEIGIAIAETGTMMVPSEGKPGSSLEGERLM